MPIRHSQLNLRRDISNGIPITPNITKVKKYYKYSVIVAQCKKNKRASQSTWQQLVLFNFIKISVTRGVAEKVRLSKYYSS